jgi:hypothetical protein
MAGRVGRPDPEHEASDVSVYEHVRSLWQPPLDERAPDGSALPVLVYDTVRDAWSGLTAPGSRAVA